MGYVFSDSEICDFQATFLQHFYFIFLNKLLQHNRINMKINEKFKIIIINELISFKE